MRANRKLGHYDRMLDSKRRRLITKDEFRWPGFPDTLCPYSSNDRVWEPVVCWGPSLRCVMWEREPAEHQKEDLQLGSESKTAETPVAGPHVQKSCSACAARDFEINMLCEECDHARQLVYHLTQQVNQLCLSALSIKNNSRRRKFLTSVSYCIFLETFLFLNAIIPQHLHKDWLSAIDQFFITLVKLQLDLTFKFILYQTKFS